MEALVDSAPLELGNRLWCDSGVSGVGAEKKINKIIQIKLLLKKQQLKKKKINQLLKLN